MSASPLRTHLRTHLRKVIGRLTPLALALLTGALLAWSLPPFGHSWLGWLALAPLLVAAAGRRLLEAFGLGLTAGLTCGWLHGYLYVPFFLLALVLGVVAAVAAAARRRRRGPEWVLVVGAAVVAAEWLTALVAPIPVNLALTQHATLPVIQVASLTGVWGVSLLLALTSAAAADAALRRTACTKALVLVVALAGLSTAGGALVLRFPPSSAALRVAAIQDCDPAETAARLGLPEPAEAAPDREQLTREAAARGARLIVWSELCLGGSFSPGARTDRVTPLASELGSHLVVGYAEAGPAGHYNCAALVAPDRSVRGVHRKIHLFLGERQGTRPGRVARAFDCALGRIGMAICFDTCYTGVTRRLVADGAQLVAMPNYDPPDRGGVLHRLHAAVLPFRAVENRVPFVRSDPNGLSQVIASDGRVLATAGMWSPAAVVAAVPLGSGIPTPFTRFGDWLAWLCVAGTPWILLRRSRRD